MLARNPLTVGTWVPEAGDRSSHLIDASGATIGTVYRYCSRWDAWADRGTSLRGKRGKLHLGPFVSEDKARAAVEAALSAPVRKPNWHVIARSHGAWPDLDQKAECDPNDEHRLRKEDCL